MNRIATTAIAAAAVAGIAGGTFAATSGFGADDPQGTGSTTGTSASATAGPFYLDGRTLVDGDTKVPVKGVTVDNVMSLERVSGGWFVVTATSPQEPAFRGTYVTPDGSTTDVGEFLGQWDVDAEGDSVVALFGDSYEIRDVTTGEVTQELNTVRGADGPLGDAAFAGDDVIAAWRDADENKLLVGTDPATGRAYDVTGTPLLNFATSPDGEHLAGERFRSQEVDGPTCLNGGPTDGIDESGWETCDWRTNALKPQFSPDGSRLLAVPYATEGLGPTKLGVLDAATGEVTAEVDLPDLATDAVWADGDTLLVHGYANADLTGGLVYECNLSGDCEQVVSSKRNIVLGS